MLDINIIREQPDMVRKALADRQMESTSVDQLLELDRQRRSTIQEAEGLKAQRNAVSKEIGKARDPAERQSKIEAMRQVGERISQLDETLLTAARMMEQHHVHRLVVVAPDGAHPIGVISTTDLVRALVEILEELDDH